MEPSVRAYVALGSNLGDPCAQVTQAMAAIDALPGCHVVARSHAYLTPPWGPVPQPDYVNAAVGIETILPPLALLDALLATERAFGRRRDGERWGPRTLDLDLLLYGALQCADERLTLPHPRIGERAFVLLPLADLDPGLEIPAQGLVRDLLAGVDTAACKRLP